MYSVNLQEYYQAEFEFIKCQMKFKYKLFLLLERNFYLKQTIIRSKNNSTKH